MVQIEAKPKSQWQFDPTKLFMVLMIVVVVVLTLTMVILIERSDRRQTIAIDQFRHEHFITRAHVKAIRYEVECVLLIPQDTRKIERAIRQCVREARNKAGLPLDEGDLAPL